MIRIGIDGATRYAGKGVSEYVGLIFVSLCKQRYLSPVPRKGVNPSLESVEMLHGGLQQLITMSKDFLL